MRKAAFVTAPLDEEKIQTILSLGINEISIHWKNYNKDLADHLRENGVKVSAEIGLIVGKDWWEKYPDSRPVDRQGNRMKPIHWYHGVCPNHPAVRSEQLANLTEIINELEIDGIWLDFIRYPCHWEEVRSSAVTEYCFCEICQKKFAAEVGGEMEGEAWIAWKCAQITGFVEEVHQRIKSSGKAIELGLFAVPWRPADFDGGIRRIIGQDFPSLAAFVSVFGVMAYHRITGNPVNWIHDIVTTVSAQTGKTVLPLVQSVPLPEPVNDVEFAASLDNAIQSPSDGVMVFHFEDMLEDQGKISAFEAL